MKIDIPSASDLDAAAGRFIEAIGSQPRVIAFYGPMGAGKTSFIAALCRQLGIDDTANSPSFAIVNEYALPDRLPLYHFDFYRIKDAAEAVDLGAEEYFYSGYTCLIEWPERVASLLPQDTLIVNIEVLADSSRVLNFEL